MRGNMSEIEDVERAKLIFKTPNPLFESFLRELIAEAKAKGFVDRLDQYEKAMVSLKKYPLQLRSGRDCVILEHFDARLCVKLDMKLKEHGSKPLRERHNKGAKPETAASSQPLANPASQLLSKPASQPVLPSMTEPVLKPNVRKNASANKNNFADEDNQGTSRGKTKEYSPAYRSAAYAILVALFNNEKQVDYKGYMTKAELQDSAQNHCDTSLKKARAGTFYTGWSAVSLLISKGLVSKKSSPAKFTLTDAGRLLAEKLVKGTDSDTGTGEISHSLEGNSQMRATGRTKIIRREDMEQNGSSQSTSASSQYDTEDMVFLPNTFEIILLLDTAETSGGPRTDDPTVSELASLSVRFEVRQLKVGDFAWIARDGLGRELVLPYIVERKRLDDLAKSIKDGRFEEQKFRLTQSGVSHIIFLFEETGSNEHLGLPIESLVKAVTNTMAEEKILVKTTDSHLNSMRFLANVTSILASAFQGKTLLSGRKEETEEFSLHDDTITLQSFNAFFHNMGKNRNFTVQEMFVKMLTQLNGMSADKATAVASRFQTPKGLMDHFVAVRDGGQSVAAMEYGDLKRKIGPTMGAILYKFYTADSFD